jgi:fatty acid desaturase
MTIEEYSDLGLAPATDSDTDPLGRVDKKTLVDSHGVRFDAFRRTLKPRFVKVWVDILGGHVALIACAAALVWATQRFGFWSLAAVPFAGLFIGYVVAYLLLFFHEAAHFNIAANRKTNDALANALIGIFVGQDIRRYREIHFNHHRHLGTIRDTERTYFAAMTPRLLFEALFGIAALRVLAGREKDTKAENKSSTNLFHRQLVTGLLFHAAILATALYFRQFAFVASWIIGVGLVFPFFATIRQVLEHRSESADPTANYARQDHGPCNRMFGSGIVASTLGGAGFNRHILHHWEPQISYTCLGALEAYLRDTSAAPAVAARTTSYAHTMLVLLGENGRKRA